VVNGYKIECVIQRRGNFSKKFKPFPISQQMQDNLHLELKFLSGGSSEL
jgi:hypothetical protein